MYIEALEAGSIDAHVAKAKDRQERIRRIVRDVFRDGVHYGSATGGIGKPSLLKPGAEEALSIFGLVADFEVKFYEPRVGPDGTEVGDPRLRYQVRCSLHQNDTSGPVIAVGHAAANSSEKKWVQRGGKPNEFIYDQDNSVLKYAEKRALVNAVLRLGFSTYFAEDHTDESAPTETKRKLAPKDLL